MVLATGLLAIVASERAMQRLELLGGRTTEAAEAAAGRLSLMRAVGCGAPASGSATGRVVEQWALSGSGPVHTETVSVGFSHDARMRWARFDASIDCAGAP